MDMTTIVQLVVIGVLAGILSGFVGVGGGIIIVPALVWLLGFNQHHAQGTSLAVLLLPVGIFAVMNYYRAGQLDWKVALIIAAGFVAGSFFGSKLSLSLPPATVKKVFGGVMIVAALKLIFGR